MRFNSWGKTNFRVYSFITLIGLTMKTSLHRIVCVNAFDRMIIFPYPIVVILFMNRKCESLLILGWLFYSFPKDERLQKWLKSCGVNEEESVCGTYRNFKVCSKHFPPSSIVIGPGGRHNLKKNAIPTM